MRINIVTPYGNNRFDLGVNEVTKLIQKAFEFSEKGSEEEYKTGGIAETLQEAVAEAWGVVADKEKEKVGYKENVVETANTDVQKTRRKSRNESLFGKGWKSGNAEKTVDDE